jgi:O-antigen ligase
MRVALGIGAAVGLVIGLAPGRWDAVLLLATAVVVAAVVGSLLRGPAPPAAPRPPLTGRQVLALAALYIVFASTLVFRQRTATELADDPLDLAGQYRVIMLAAAFVLACVSMLSRRFTLRGVPAAGWFVVAYVAVVPLGALEAVSVSLVLFKWVELVTFVIVWLAVTRAFPNETSVPLRHFVIATGLVVVAVLAGIVFFPGETLAATDNILPIQLRSTLPELSANDVGTLGLVLAAFGLGRARISAGLVALGVALLLAAQYRTGYVALLAMIVVVLVLRRHAAARVLLVGLAVLIPLAAQSSVIEDVWLRDEASAATLSTLTGRTVWWAEAIEATDRSPVTGIGLSSGVRFEVLQARFNGTTSTIHSTWVEAYVGVGLLGVGLLAAAALLGVLAAWRRWSYDGDTLPSVLLTLLLVKSITGSTFEIGGSLLLLFLLALSAADDRPPRLERVPDPGLDQALSSP